LAVTVTPGFRVNGAFFASLAAIDSVLALGALFEG
jgi:hypothetical protein